MSLEPKPELKSVISDGYLSDHIAGQKVAIRDGIYGLAMPVVSQNKLRPSIKDFSTKQIN